MKKILPFFILGFLLFLSFCKADRYYLYSCGTILTSNNEYVLLTDVYSEDYYCFQVSGENITLDLNGHTVEVGGEYAGYITLPLYPSVSNMIIKNGKIINSKNIGYCPGCSKFGIKTYANTTIDSIEIILNNTNTGSNYAIYIPCKTSNVKVKNVTINFYSTSGTQIAIYVGGDSSYNSIINSKIVTEDPNALDLYFEGSVQCDTEWVGPSHDNYVCAEFNISKVVDRGYNNNITYCPYTPPTPPPTPPTPPPTPPLVTFTYFPLGKYDEDFYNFNYTSLKGRQQWYLASGLNIDPYTFTDMRGVSRNVPKIAPPAGNTLTTDAFWITIPNDNRINYVVVYYGFEGMEVKVKIESAIGEEWVLDEDSASVPLKTRYRIFNIKNIITGANPPYRLVFWGDFLNMWYQNEYITKLVPINVQFLDSEMRVIDNQEFSETTLYFTDFSTSNPFMFGYGSNIQPKWESKYLNIDPPFKYYPYSWLSLTYNATNYDSFFYSSTPSYYDLRGKNIDIYRVDLTLYMFCYPPINKTTIFIWNATPDNVVDKGTKIEIYRDKVNVYLLDKDFHIIDGEVGLTTGNLRTQDDLICMNKLIYLRTPNYARLIGVRGDKNIVLIDIPYRLTTSFNRVVYMWDTEIAANINVDVTDFMVLSGAPVLSQAVLTSNKYSVATYEPFTLTASWKGGVPPFVVYYYYYDGTWRYFGSSPYITEYSYSYDLSWGIAGNWTFKAVIIDSTNSSIETNNVTINVYSPPAPFRFPLCSINGILFPELNLTPPFTLNVRIWNMSGGFPPYEVSYQRLNIKIFTCYNVPEYGECSGNISSFEIPYLTAQCKDYNTTHQICMNAFIVNTTDSHGSIYISNGGVVNVILPKVIAPLNVSLTLTPMLNLTSNTSTIIRATVIGGAPPIELTFLHRYGADVICKEILNQTNITRSLTVYWYGGDHNIHASARSADGQVATSDSIDFYVEPVSPPRYKNFVIGCIGTMSGPNTPNEQESFYPYIPTPPTPPYVPLESTKPLANETEWREIGIAWALPLTTPIFILTMVALGVSGFIAMKIGGNYAGLVFGVAMLFFIIIYSITGVYPIWISIILIILTAGLIAYFIKGMF
jgi:hypothetical protein